MAILDFQSDNFNYCWSTSHFDTFNINVYGPYKWGSKFDLGGKRVKCQHRIIILAILVDLLSPINCAKIRTQSLFDYGEEDF